MTISTGVAVDFGDALTTQTITTKLDEAAALKPEPIAPTSDALATQATAIVATGGETLVGEPVEAGKPVRQEAFMCRDMLLEEQRVQARAIAEREYPKLLASPVALGDFGNVAVEGINAMVRRMLNEAGRAANIPELTALTRQLDRRLRDFTKDQEERTAATKAREQYGKAKLKIMGLFGAAKDMLHELLRDAQGIQKYLDGLEADLVGQRHQLSLNVELCNELYAENEAAINKLIAVIAVMEYVRDVAWEAAEAIQPAGPKEREMREERETILEFYQAMDVRIGEFKQRLFVAWATGPQIRKIRAISYGLGQRLALLVNLTVPVFRLTIVEWVALEQANQAGKTAEAVGDVTDTVMSTWAEASKQMVGATARQIQTPSMRAETVLLVAQSLADQAKSVEEAFQFGIQARGRVNGAIVKANQIMADTADRHAANMLALVSEAQEPFALPAGPNLPKEVTSRADDAFKGLI